jgi:hypothetical protein
MQIENGIPIPEGTGRNRWPFNAMEVGQSVFAEGAKDGVRAATAAKVYGLRTGKKFTCRKMDNGHRIWRIA